MNIAMNAPDTPYPVRVDAASRPTGSRGLWLVKWLLLVPHLVVLALLWLVFVLFTIAAFFAIVITGRYPVSLFDFNVGVLRWTWRVGYYGYSALGTDRYPPFTLRDDPTYPARLDIPYPARLSRGLVLVKWWLLALPHYVIVALFAGGGLWFATTPGSRPFVFDVFWGAGGLIGLLVLIAAIVLLFTGRYPASLYDFVLGMNRWSLRVAAYAALMTDSYPPFRLDMGGPDPGTSVVAEPPNLQPTAAGGAVVGNPPAGAPSTEWRYGAQPVVAEPARWSAGRVVAVVLGALMLFVGAGALTGGGALVWMDNTQRDSGFVAAPSVAVSSLGHAVVATGFRAEGSGFPWFVDHVLGTVRLKASAHDDAHDLFIGIGPAPEVSAYLRDVEYTELTRFGARWGGGAWREHDVIAHHGSAPAAPPTSAPVWAASASGHGAPSLTWRPVAGDWAVVVMHADAAPGIDARVQAAATLPGLWWIGATVIGIGVLLLAGGGLAVGIAVHRASRSTQVRAGST